MLIIKLLYRILNLYILYSIVHTLSIVFILKNKAVFNIIRFYAVYAAYVTLIILYNILIHLIFKTLLEIGHLVID